MSRFSRLLLNLTLALLGSSMLMADGLNVRDLVRLNRLSDAQLSPDGKVVVYVLRETDMEANKGRTDLWMVSAEGGESRRLTSHEAADFHPRFSPDGQSIHFLSTRSGSSQIWRIALDGGEAMKVSDLPLDVNGFALAPEGKNFIVALEVFVDCETLDCTVDRLAEKEDLKTSGVLYEKMFIRHWDTWKDGRRSHLFLLPKSGGEVRDLMTGVEGDAPTKPWGGMEEVAFTPDGLSLVYVARTDDEAEPWSTDFDLWQVDLQGEAKATELTAANKAWDTAPTFSPDGQSLAYLAMKRPGFEADRFAIMVRNLKTGAVRELAPEWDRSPSSIFYSADGKTLYAVAQNLGQRGLFALDSQTGSVREVMSEGTLRSPLLTPEGDLIFGWDSLTAPVDLWRMRLDSGEKKRLTAVNEAALSTITMGAPEQFSFAGWNNETVYGYVVKPADFQDDQQYPIAFLIHGGPQGSFGNNFHYRWNPQTYTGAGFAAVMIDFHGSTGYGQSFTDSISGDWGGKPLEDLQKGLAAALAKYSWLDGNRSCALGASYGGYMINWIAGQWNDGFSCLVNHDGVFDHRAMYYETEELWFPEWEHGGTPWEKPEAYAKDNPVLFVGQWKTPMLVVHGGRDYRIPDTQGFAVFTALQRQGIPSQLLYFPKENHWVLKPHNSIQWHDTVLDWLNRWTQTEP